MIQLITGKFLNSFDLQVEKHLQSILQNWLVGEVPG